MCLFIVKTSFARYACFLLSLVYGARDCVGCGAKAYRAPFCEKCQKALEDFVDLKSPERCAVCGRVLVSENSVCLSCREQGAKNLDALYPLHSYRLWKKELVFAWKMQDERGVSPVFARIISKALKSVSLDRLPIVPVPPRPEKLRERGWDQIEDIAKILCKKHGSKIMRLLVRHGGGSEQKKLNRNERLLNSSAYALSPLAEKISGGVVPEEVVLIDDVVTTGATLEKCAALLKGWGVKKVHGMALFAVG